MSLVDISFLIEDPDFAKPFIAYRKTGNWKKGGKFVQDEVKINHFGIVQPASTEDIEQLPQGDRVKGVMCFYSRKEIHLTRTGDDETESGTSDEIEWHKKRYKVIQVMPYSDYGFVKAFGVRMEGS